MMMTSNSRVALILLACLGSGALAGPRDKHPKKKAATPAATAKDPDAGAGSGLGKARDLEGSGSGSGSTPTEAVGTTPEGAGSAAPPPDTKSKDPKDAKDAAPSEKEPDVDSLRQEYLSLRDELFKSRARANAVASQLYSTRITIKFSWSSSRYYGVTKASVRLDGATVYEDAGGAIGGDDGVRFDGYVAPGRHLVTFHVDATGKDDDSFTSSTESQVVVKAVAQKDLAVNAKAHDGGDIAYEWKRSEHGSYGLGIDVAVKTAKPLAGDTTAPTKGTKK